MMKKTVEILICLLLTAGIAFGQDDIALKTLEKGDAKISFPLDWTVDESGLMGTEFIFFIPEEPADEFRENVNLMIQPMGAVVDDFAPIISATEEQLSNLITDYSLIASEEKEGYYFLEYTGKQGVYDLHWKQRLFLQGENLYILTFTASVEDFEASNSAAVEVMNSFEIQN